MNVMKNSIWTTATYAKHNESMRKADKRFQAERDKRYAEGNELRAMALKIKETADANALELASESQTYKEARNDAMREQNLKETGVYATKDDLASVFAKSEKALNAVAEEIRNAFKPMLDHIASDKGSEISTGKLYAGITVIAIILGVVFSIINHFMS